MEGVRQIVPFSAVQLGQVLDVDAAQPRLGLRYFFLMRSRLSGAPAVEVLRARDVGFVLNAWRRNPLGKRSPAPHTGSGGENFLSC